MRWKGTLCIAVALVAVTSSQLTVLENTIENNIIDNHEETSNDEDSKVLDSDETHVITTTTDANEPEGDQFEVTTVTDDVSDDVTTDHTTETTAQAETVSVQAPDILTTVHPVQNTPPRSEEIRTSSEELIDVGPENLQVIDTTSGPVRGLHWQDNTNILSYMDIPYGIFKEPFQPPIPPERSETVLENTEHNKRCPQLYNDDYVGDDDCLTLSIFAPHDVVNASVLFHIYDGKFVSGSGDPAMYGPEYLVPQGVILVLPNYRLGPLGFLCQLDEIVPGNAALKDLTLALNWTRENIKNFGGNPYNIIVSGDGMSGALAGYLALSPISRKYINKVIVESGSVLSHWALDRHPLINAAELREKIDRQEIQKVDLKSLTTAAKGIIFKPCIENGTDAFMTDTPWSMIHNENNDITFMIGTAKYAGIHEALQADESLYNLNENYGWLLPNDLIFKTEEEKATIGRKVKTQYFGESEIKSSDIQKLALYFTDAAYLSPGIRSARPLVETGATVYVYEFSFVGEFNRELASINKPVDGAVRGDIIGYVFMQDGQVPREESSEERMIRTLVELWVNFMQTGKPSAENIDWNKLDKSSVSEEEWLSIDTDLAMKKGIHLDRLQLWTEIYNEHFIERSLAFHFASSVYVVLIAQFIFWISFFKNISHLT